MDRGSIVEDRSADELAAAIDELICQGDPSNADPTNFLGRQFDAGLAWVWQPVGSGGRGLPRSTQHGVNTALFAAGAPNPVIRNPIGYGMAAPTILAHGSAEQQRRYLRPLFTGEEMWCQLFSEPGAGSDVAALATRAVRDGDNWIVTGQKVWTTLAHRARWGLLVVRTDPDLPKHEGLTYLIVDMRSRGVEVRPLFQMTGEAEFNEVYLTEVCVPDSNRLGAVGDGWRVVRTTLMNERVSIGDVPRRGGGLLGAALETWKGIDQPGRAVRRDQLAKLYSRSQALRWTNLRSGQTRAAGIPGPEGSIAKLMSAELNQALADFTVSLLGAHGMLHPSGYPMARPDAIEGRRDPQYQLLRMQANTIEGGTSDILRNLLAEQILGLPREPSADKGVPWSESLRS